MAYLLNAWYVVALSQEIQGDAVLNRTVLDQSILAYRREDGTPVVLADRCPHRFVPLHLGKRVGDDMVCPYHGLRFDCSGKCVESPHGDGLIPKAAVVRSYPAVERYGFIWAWMGDAARADEGQLPDYSLLDGGHPNSKGYGYMKMQANYELIVDNIMDLSHVDHVHGPLLNTAGKLSPQIPKVEENGSSVKVGWKWFQEPAMGYFSPFLPDSKKGANHYVSVAWSAPASMLLTVGAVQGSTNEDDGLLSWDFHIMTPETETSTHYFFGNRRNWLVDSAELNKLKLEGTLEAFSTEDKPIIEAAQAEMKTTDLWALQPVLLSSDAAPVRVRRVLQKLLAGEAPAA